MDITEKQVKEFCKELELLRLLQQKLISDSKRGATIIIERHCHYYDPLKQDYSADHPAVPGETQAGETIAIRIGMCPEIKFK